MSSKERKNASNNSLHSSGRIRRRNEEIGKLEVAVFDNDGTLLPRAIPDYWLRSATITIKSMQNECPGLLSSHLPHNIAYILSHDPMQIDKFMAPHQRSPEKVQEYVNKYRQTALDLLMAHPPKEGPHVRNQLLRLKDENIKIAIATSAIGLWIEAVLDVMGIRDLVDAVYSQSDLPTGTNSLPDPTFLKPHPYQLEAIMRDLKVSPRKTSMLGDTKSDWLAATRAGVRTNFAVFYPENKSSNPRQNIQTFQAQYGSLTGVVFSLKHAVSAMLARRV